MIVLQTAFGAIILAAVLWAAYKIGVEVGREAAKSEEDEDPDRLD